MRKEILEQSRREKKILGIRLYGEDDELWLGYIENYNEEIIQLRYFDQFGFEDGLVIEMLDNIESIDFDSDYEKTYQYLINKRQDINKIENIISFKDSSDWKIEYLYDLATRNEILSLRLSGTVVYGIIGEIGEKEFVLNAIGNVGQNEGRTVYKLEDISAFRFADKKSKLRQELQIWRKSNKTGG